MLTASLWCLRAAEIRKADRAGLERKQQIRIMYLGILGMERKLKKIINSFSISSAVQVLPGSGKSHCRQVIILIDTVNGTIKLEKITWQLR